MTAAEAREPGIRADFCGECRNCHEWFDRGERVAKVGRGYVHVGCQPGASDE